MYYIYIYKHSVMMLYGNWTKIVFQLRLSNMGLYQLTWILTDLIIVYVILANLPCLRWYWTFWSFQHGVWGPARGGMVLSEKDIGNSPKITKIWWYNQQKWWFFMAYDGIVMLGIPRPPNEQCAIFLWVEGYTGLYYPLSWELSVHDGKCYSRESV